MIGLVVTEPGSKPKSGPSACTIMKTKKAKVKVGRKKHGDTDALPREAKFP